MRQYEPRRSKRNAGIVWQVLAVGCLASQRVRGARRRGFFLIAQLLLSQVPKFIFPASGLAGFLPKLIRSRFNFFFVRFGHCISPIVARPYVQG